MPVLDQNTLDIISHSVDQTRRLGHRLGALLQAGDVICLEGDLGAGKTCLAQGVGQGLGVQQPITSPSFTLVSEYRAAPSGLTFYHVDLYRLGDAVSEALALGLEEVLYGEGICLIEWAERAASILPEERLWITLRHLEPTKRSLLLHAEGARYAELLHQFRYSAFGH
jgi:tRNA threonylcarbamoyladenosine biosynthesis protein TsaE